MLVVLLLEDLGLEDTDVPAFWLESSVYDMPGSAVLAVSRGFQSQFRYCLML